MKTQSEWIAYFRSLDFDNGHIWHMMDALCALGMVRSVSQQVQKEG